MLQSICLFIYILLACVSKICFKEEGICLKESAMMSNQFLQKKSLNIEKCCSIFHYKYIISLRNLLCCSLCHIYPYHKMQNSGKFTEYHKVAECRCKWNQKWFIIWWVYVCYISAIGCRWGLSREGALVFQSSYIDLTAGVRGTDLTGRNAGKLCVLPA